jgi:predicted ATP-dependent endonuclease of OLD family
MQIEIKNFGPIDHIKVDLNKDLHLIFGKNAIGKSYTTYCIYCLLKNIKNKTSIYRHNYYGNIENNRFHKFVKSSLKLKNKTSEIDFKKKFIEIIEEDLKNIILSGLENSILNTFSSLDNLRNRRTDKNLELIISLSDTESINIFVNEEGALDLKYTYKSKKFEIKLKDTKTTKYSLYIDDKMSFGKGNEEEFSFEFVRYSTRLMDIILNRLDFDIKDIYYLPASRSGLYQALNAFTPIIAELTQSRFFMQNKSIELPSLSEPLSDYFIDLSTVDKTNTNKEFNEIIEYLENEILRGKVEYDDVNKRIMYKPKDVKIELNLSEASSMVSELSPLVIYFKHILNHKYSSKNSPERFLFGYGSRYREKNKGYDVLFIEEPEAHLHPEVQVKLIALFVKLTKLKLKVFITSHSNYMFNKLNNILIKNEIDESKVKVYHLIQTDNGTIDSKDMKVTQEGINDENFQDVSEELYYERLELLEGKDDSRN